MEGHDFSILQKKKFEFKPKKLRLNMSEYNKYFSWFVPLIEYAIKFIQWG